MDPRVGVTFDSRALESVIDPELHRSIVELDMVRSIEIGANGVVDVTVSLTTRA